MSQLIDKGEQLINTLLLHSVFILLYKVQRQIHFHNKRDILSHPRHEGLSKVVSIADGQVPGLAVVGQFVT